MSNYCQQIDPHNAHSASGTMTVKRHKKGIKEKITEISPNFQSFVNDLSDDHTGDFQMTSSEYKEERLHVCKVIAGLRNYSDHMFLMLSRANGNFYKLSPEHRRMIPEYADRLDRFRAAIKINTSFLNSILAACDQVFVNSDVANTTKLEISSNDFRRSFSRMDIEKVDVFYKCNMFKVTFLLLVTS